MPRPKPAEKQEHGSIYLDETLACLLRERSALRGYIARRLDSSQDAEDYVQEVYSRVLAAAPKKKILNARGFLFRIASNLLADHRRRARARRAHMHVPIDEEGPIQDDDAISPEHILLAREQLRLMEQEIELLDPISREVFRLVRLQGMSHREVAGLTGLEVKAVSRVLEKTLVRLARAIARGARE